MKIDETNSSRVHTNIHLKLFGRHIFPNLENMGKVH